MGQAQTLANVYRPQGPKVVATGNPVVKSGSMNLVNQVDLSVQITSLRFVLTGRITVATAAYTSVKPEQFLNLIQELRIQGNNTRQKGTVTLLDQDLASFLGFKSLFSRRAFSYYVSKAGGNLTVNPYPSTPYVGGGFDGSTATFDFRIVFDVPFYPFTSGDAFIPGWTVRASEWPNGLNIYAKFATLADNAENEIGVSAATTVTTLAGFGGGGSAQLDVYSIPAIMGQQLAPTTLPGVLSRTVAQLSSSLGTTGTSIKQLDLEKQFQGRILFKTGVSTLFPNFSSLSDGIMTASGVVVGGNRFVRNVVDSFSHKEEWSKEYHVDPIQGYMGFDFLQSDNPFSAFDGKQVAGAATFQLVSNVTTVANAAGIVLQEQQLYQPSGPLYTS